jgi:PST family polysaccharide transporter
MIGHWQHKLNRHCGFASVNASCPAKRSPVESTAITAHRREPLQQETPSGMSDGIKERVVRGVVWSGFQAWFRRIFLFLIFPILARILGPETYGLVALAGVFFALLDVFSEASFGAALEQKRDLEPEHIDAVFWAFLALGLVMAVAGIACAPQVARFFDEPALKAVVSWLTLGILIQSASGVQRSLLRRDLRFKELAQITLAAALLGGTAGIGMAFAGFGVWSLVGQRLLMRLTILVLVWRTSDWRPRLRFSWRHLREVAGFGLSVMGNRILNYLNRQLDQVLVGRALGKIELGYYFNASRLLSEVTNVLVGGYSQIAMPAFARLQDDRSRFHGAYAQAIRYVTLIAFPVFAGLSITAGDFIQVLLGDEWQASAPALRWLALAGIVQSLAYVNSAAILAVGRADTKLAVEIVHSICNVVGFVVAIRYGFVAVAAAFTIRAWLLLPLDIYVGRRVGALSIVTTMARIWPQTLAAMVMAGAVMLLQGMMPVDWSSWPRLLACVAVGCIAYGVVVALADRSLWSDVRNLLTTLRSPEPARPEDSP